MLALAFSHGTLTLYANMHAKTTMHTITRTFSPALPVIYPDSSTFEQRRHNGYNVFLTDTSRMKNFLLIFRNLPTPNRKVNLCNLRSCFLNGLALLVIPDQVFISHGQGCTGKSGIDVSRVREIVFIANTRARENVNPFG